MIRIYLSYTRSDFDFVRKLTYDLEKLGLSYWLDIEHIGGADDPRPLVRAALEECQILFLVSSKAALESKRIQSEYTYFLSKKKHIIPLVVERSLELPSDLAGLSYTDFTLFDYERSFDNLRRSLVMLLQGIRSSTTLIDTEYESTTYQLELEQIQQAMREAVEDKLKTSKISIDGGETRFGADTILELRVSQYNAKVFEFPLKTGQSYVIGRADNQSRPDIDLSLFDAVEKGVSRRHAELKAINDRLYITDLDSRNFTFLNEERLESEKYYLVSSGDVIRLGSFVLIVEFLQKNMDFSKL
jgi:pSer/pThr/pTyr-binding forkhead associated (FHA) protein